MAGAGETQAAARGIVGGEHRGGKKARLASHQMQALVEKTEEAPRRPEFGAVVVPHRGQLHGVKRGSYPVAHHVRHQHRQAAVIQAFDPVKIAPHQIARLVADLDLEPRVVNDPAFQCEILDRLGTKQIVDTGGGIAKHLDPADGFAVAVAQRCHGDLDRRAPPDLRGRRPTPGPRWRSR